METKLSIAIQKSGRLSEKSMALLRECGISLSNGAGRLKAGASNFPLEVLFLRDDDIPGYVHGKVGDDASGTNHTLPTNGAANGYSGVSLDSLVKKITFQQLDREGGRSMALGVNKIAQKVGEEAVETVIEAMDGNRDRLKEESADLLYHLIVLLRQQGLQLAEVEEVLRRRHDGSALG